MSPDTIAHLNQLNRAFYAITANEFSATRGRAWQGWLDLMPYLPQRPLRVLDVGCGNGRWGALLAEHGRLAHYDGIDNNPTLLTYAEQAFSAYPHISARLIQADVIEDAGASLAQITQGDLYDVVGVFGVLHHVPALTHRLGFVEALARRVTQGGVLALATWRFYEFERFRQRIITWQDYDAEQGTQLAQEAEAGDYLLDWRRGERALRYCHYVNDDEQDALRDVSGMEEVARYRADGEANAMNCYSVLTG